MNVVCIQQGSTSDNSGSGRQHKTKDEEERSEVDRGTHGIHVFVFALETQIVCFTDIIPGERVGVIDVDRNTVKRSTVRCCCWAFGSRQQVLSL